MYLYIRLFTIFILYQNLTVINGQDWKVKITFVRVYVCVCVYFERVNVCRTRKLPFDVLAAGFDREDIRRFRGEISRE